VPAKSIAELVALAKDKPGSVTYGTAGVGTALHTGALLLESLTGTKLTAVHYRGAAPALGDVVAGHINMVIMGPSVALPAVRAGNLRMLGFGSERRVPQFPDVPTIAETVAGYEAGVSFGLFAPAGTPPAIVDKINADIQNIIGDPEFQTKFLEPQVVQPLPGPREAFAAYLRKDSAKWAKVIKAANLKID
jgi:tripartite-type tricarboxylate transporter receptor subunit TctC